MRTDFFKYFLLIALIPNFLFAQEDLLNSLESSQNKKEFTTASFKGTRIINSHSLEVLGRRSLDFRIAHRFGPFNSGGNNLWGLDGPATIRLSLEYSFDGRLMFGLGRSSYQKLYDGMLKYRVLRQTTNNSMPFSLTLYGAINVNGQKRETIQMYDGFSGRVSYVYQAIIGRKFSKSLSLQLSPTMIHYNLVEKTIDRNDVYAVMFAGRYKFSRSVAVTFEYGWRIKSLSNDYSSYNNSAGIGFDIETGGHVFQVFLTNSIAMNEVQFIPSTNSSWAKGGIRLGFNISRVFAI